MANEGKRLLVLGANGQLGQAVVQVAKEAKFEVRAGVRNTKKFQAEGVEVVQFSFKDLNLLKAALDGVDAVICTVAAKDSNKVMRDGLTALVSTMQEDARLIFTSCKAATDEGYGRLGLFEKFFTYGITLRHQRRDLIDLEAHFETETRDHGPISNICYTMVRLPTLKNKGTTGGRFREDEDTIVEDDVLSSMHRLDAARYLVDCVIKHSFERGVVNIGIRR